MVPGLKFFRDELSREAWGLWYPEVVCVRWNDLPEKRLLKEVWKDDHIWSSVGGKVPSGTWDPLQSPSEREPGKRGEMQGPGPKAMETAEEVGAVGRHGWGAEKRDI